MNVVRNEIRTGLVVLFTLTVLVSVLIYLGAPGVFTPQKEFGIYFDNAAGMRVGTPVMLAGRKVGQVVVIDSPVSTAERPKGKDGKPLPLEARVMVRVDREARIFMKCKVALGNYNLLSEPVIDFTEGEESSGLAPEKTLFVGERPGGLADAGLQIIEKIDPAVKQLSSTLKSLEVTSNNLTALTADSAELSKAIIEIRKVATNLNEVTGAGGSLRRALDSIEKLGGSDGEVAKALADFSKLVGPGGDLAKAIANVEKFTKDLSANKDIELALKNLRSTTERANAAVYELRAGFSAVSGNLEQATDTLKRQPWRLIWPSTKKYRDETPTPTPAPKPQRKR